MYHEVLNKVEILLVLCASVSTNQGINKSLPETEDNYQQNVFEICEHNGTYECTVFVTACVGSIETHARQNPNGVGRRTQSPTASQGTVGN